MYLTHLFQVRRNWLTWNTDCPQRALKQGLVFQVIVRNAKMNAMRTTQMTQRDKKRGFIPVAHNKQLFMRADSKRVSQIMWLGVRYNGGGVRHRLGYVFLLHRVLRVIPEKGSQKI